MSKGSFPNVKNKSATSSLSFIFEPGRVLQTHPYVQGVNPEGEPYTRYFALTAKYGIHTDGRKLWQQLYNYPVWGGGLFYGNFRADKFVGEDRMLNELFQIIEDRKANPTKKSYTARLLSEGEDRILQKIGEEAVEVILAAKGQGNQRLLEETADLFYHTLVLLSAKELTLGDVEAELRKRHK